MWLPHFPILNRIDHRCDLISLTHQFIYTLMKKKVLYFYLSSTNWFGFGILMCGFTFTQNQINWASIYHLPPEVLFCRALYYFVVYVSHFWHQQQQLLRFANDAKAPLCALQAMFPNRGHRYHHFHPLPMCHRNWRGKNTSFFERKAKTETVQNRLFNEYCCDWPVDISHRVKGAVLYSLFSIKQYKSNRHLCRLNERLEAIWIDL